MTIQMAKKSKNDAHKFKKGNKSPKSGKVNKKQRKPFKKDLKEPKNKPPVEDVEDEEEMDDEEQIEDVPEEKPKPRKESHDVDQGKTVFVRNMSFETTEEALRLFMTNIGPVEYCLLCRYKESGQSKGSAFVKFRKRPDAERAVSMAQDQMILDGRKLNLDIALPRDIVEKAIKKNKEKERDKRNLYLTREGLIHAGSEAANGVSQHDLEKRLALEGKKRMLLQVLTNFMSKNRLCIHNLPPEVDNGKLKAIFKEAAPGSRIIEARVMRNRKANGKFSGTKGFGFVEFEKHEDALLALRKLNNNPDIFTDARRPIVEFSVEDKLALNKRMRQRIKNEQKREQEAAKKGKKPEKKAQAEKKAQPDKKVLFPKDEQKMATEPVTANKVEIKNPKMKIKPREEVTSSFSGFVAEPLKPNEAVAPPKINRKLKESKKLITEKFKEKKSEQKKERTKKEHLSKRQQKLARRKAAQELKAAASKPKELDAFEEKFVKKSGHVLVDDRMSKLPIPTAKVKWFESK